MIDDLKETFDNLRVYKMMLNQAKCVFGVPAGKLLGSLVSNRGIEANLEKIEVITSLVKPVCINDVQRLAGRIAALSRFISQLGEKAITTKKYTSVTIRVCHSRSCFLSCMYIHDKFMTESR